MTSSSESNNNNNSKPNEGDRKPSKPNAKRKGGAKPGCPRGTKNHPSWYMKDGTPQVGANFAALRDITPESATGIVTEAIMHIETAIVPPIDENNSFWQKISELYTEIREQNAGAANYTPGVLGCYYLNLQSAYAVFFDLVKKLLTVAMTERTTARSSWLMSVVAGNYSYRDMSTNYADRLNDLTLLAKELQVFPVLKTAAMERMKFYFKSLFKDSSGEKPVYLAFHPFAIGKYAHTTSQGVTTITATTQYFGHSSDQNSWGDEVSFVQGIISTLTNDPVMTILRGDIRHAFGNLAMNDNLVSEIGTLPINEPDADVMSKLENANLLGQVSTANYADFTISVDPATGTNAVTLPHSGSNDPDVRVRAAEDAMLINWHKNTAPTYEELASITRTMSLGTLKNELTRSRWNVTCTDGLIIIDFRAVSSYTDTSISLVQLFGLMAEAQGGTISSLRQLAFYTSVCDHMPMFYTINKSGTFTGKEVIWDMDNFAVIYAPIIRTINSRVVRSLYDVHPPRGEHGRKEKSP